MLRAALCAGVAWPAAAAAQAPGSALAELASRAELVGTARVEWAFGLSDAESQKLELVLEPELELELPAGLDLTAVGRLRADAFDELEPGAPTQHERSVISRRALVGDRVDLELRELYVEGEVGRALFTLGKQQIVWGRADGLKVLDVVNPQDFREFILPDFDESRIPLWAVNTEVPLGEFALQLVWLPDPTFHDLPEEDALFAFTSPELIPSAPPGVPVTQRSVDRPREFIRDSDAGARLSTSLGGFDLTLNYLWHYDDEPVLFREILAEPTGPRVVVAPGYERTQLVGATFANAFGELTVRGELGFSIDRFFPTEDPADPDGVVRANELDWVLGLDWYGLRETLLSVQLFQTRLSRDPAGMIRDEFATNVTFLARREFRNDRVAAQLACIHGVDHGDGLARARVGFELREGLELFAGLDVFYGSERGVFGEFDHNDRLVVGFEIGL
ncbi:MAG TPA: DUF1302 family protein [Myxococcota bacterium]|nr:DUF1302 family protein [Myxococcota bacterium]